MEHIILFIGIFFRAAVLFLFLHVLFSMLLPGDNPVRMGISRIVDPVLNPFRRIMKPINGIDFSPVLAMSVIYLIEWLVTGLIRWLFSA